MCVCVNNMYGCVNNMYGCVNNMCGCVNNMCGCVNNMCVNNMYGYSNNMCGYLGIRNEIVILQGQVRLTGIFEWHSNCNSNDSAI
jgi:hypothetical protein